MVLPGSGEDVNGNTWAGVNVLFQDTSLSGIPKALSAGYVQTFVHSQKVGCLQFTLRALLPATMMAVGGKGRG